MRFKFITMSESTDKGKRVLQTAKEPAEAGGCHGESNGRAQPGLMRSALRCQQQKTDTLLQEGATETNRV